MHTLRRLGYKFPTMIVAVAAIWTFIWVDASGQTVVPPKDSPLRAEGYILPPKIILDAIPGAHPEERLLYTNICPDGKKFLVTKGTGMPSVHNMSRPAVHLGDTAFEHTANRSHALYSRSNSGYELFFYADKRTVPVEIPAKSRVSNPVWSPDGSQLAFYVHTYDATYLYVADTASGKSRKVTPIPVQATLVTNFAWTGDGKRIQAVIAPDDGTRRFPFNEHSVGPMIRVTETAQAKQQRTIRYLMETPHDMALLEHLITGQLAVIDVASGKVTNVGKPAMLKSVNASPGADSYRVATMDKKGFSFYSTFASFPSSEGLWNSDGKQVYSFKKAGGGKGGGDKGKKKDPVDPDPDPDKQQKKDEPKDDPEGKRDLGWRPDGVGMSYLKLEAPKKDSKDPRKDYVMQWLPPWNETSTKVVYESTNPITSVQYNDNCTMMFITVTADNSRQIVAVDLKDEKKPTWVVYKGAAAGGVPDPVLDPEVIADDEPTDPWDFMALSTAAEQKGAKGGDKGGGAPAGGLMTRSRGSAKVVRISSEEEVYVSGNEKAKPFIDKIAIKTGKKTRIFTGKGEMSESIDTVNGDNITIVFTNGQKRTVPPNTYMHELASGKVTKMTNNVDHTPWFHELKTERVQITREDGFKFWAKVTTSPNVKKKAPAMFWFYPKEYTDQAAYNGKGGGGKAAGGGGKAPNDNAKYAAPGTRSMSILTVLGYAVVEPDCPIVGPAGKMNDNYVKDLKSSLTATVDELAKLEFIDPDRLALGGHSYGAFSTANAMCHTKLFKAGIAGDGCYNRTLTPMSFQTEKRNIWQAQDTYIAMSPLLNADKLSGALLMYHGAWDRNVGTAPINSERMFMALRGFGKPCALYMYPYEDHGPVGKETQLDMWARWVPWLDMYVMNYKAPEAKK